MTKETNDALEKMTIGIEELLSGLTAEPNTVIDYNKSILKKACKELRRALQNEPVQKGNQ